MQNKFFSLSEPYLFGNELKYLHECINSNQITSGQFNIRFEKKITNYTKSKYAILCINGTAALHIALKILGVKKGDEVIVSTLTFVASVNSIVYNQASPIFLDTDAFFNIDEEKCITFINRKTYFKNGYSFNKTTNRRIAAIMPVHVWGNPVKFDKLITLCKKRNIKIVEDATESLGSFYLQGKYKGKHPGTIGEIGCVSFNGNKIITSGGGGAILTNNRKYYEKAKYLMNQSKDDDLYYIHNSIGYNYRISNLHSAIGLAQIENIDKYIDFKNKIRATYINLLKNNHYYDIYENPKYSRNNNWLNILNLKKINKKYNINKLLNYLIKNKIQARPIWQLNHRQYMFKKYQTYEIKNAVRQIQSSVCLPSAPNLTQRDIKKIVNILNNY